MEGDKIHNKPPPGPARTARSARRQSARPVEGGSAREGPPPAFADGFESGLPSEAPEGL